MRSSRSIFTIALSFLIALSVALAPIRAMAASDNYGDISNWDGVVTVDFSGSRIYLDVTHTSTYQQSTGDPYIYPTSVMAVYNGGVNASISIVTDSIGSYLNGYLRKRVQVSPNAVPSNADVLYASVSGEPIILDDMYIITDVVQRDDDGNLTFDVFIRFNNYYVSTETIELPLYVEFDVDVAYNTLQSSYVPGSMLFDISVIDDYSGEVKQYDSILDTPTIEGDFAQQNQQIIDSIHENTQTVDSIGNSIIDSILSNITNLINNIKIQFSDLTTNLTNWYNGLISNLNTNFDRLLNQNNDEHEELVNGYQGTDAPAADEAFTAGADELTSIEGELSDSANANIDNYTTTAFDASFITTLGPSLVYVVTWFTNFWNMGGLFTQLLNIGLALFVAFFILRVRGKS